MRVSMEYAICVINHLGERGGAPEGAFRGIGVVHGPRQTHEAVYVVTIVTT